MGSGPAGMHAALLLAREGIAVEIFEREKKLGGMLQYYLPKFRFTREGIPKKIKALKKLGVKIWLGTNIGKGKSLDGLLKKFDAVVLASGEWNARKLGIAGEELDGVQYWLEFLRDYNEGKVQSLKGKNVVVIGAGDTAMDCTRAAIDIGGKTVIAYRRGRTDIPAMEQEMKGAIDDGAGFLFYHSPMKFEGAGKLEKIVFEKTRAKDGKVVGTGKMVEVGADLAVIAIGQMPDLSVLEGSKWKSLEELPGNIVLCGDLVNDRKLIATAVKSAAEAVGKIRGMLTGGRN